MHSFHANSPRNRLKLTRNDVGRLLTLCLLCLVITACGGDEAAPLVATPTAAQELDTTPLAGPVAGGALLEEDDVMTSEDDALATAAASATDATVVYPEPSVPLPTVDPLEVDGDITVGGSATVYPITRRLYRRFVREGYAGVMKIERVGTGEGFRLLCSVGTADLVNAGRAVHEDETKLCASINRVPVPFTIGQSAIALFVHPENTFVSAVSLTETRTIFTATLWSDVNPLWPQEPIVRLLPRADSDEVAAFARLLFDGDRDPFLQAPNTTAFDTDSELVQALADSPNAVGFAKHPLLLQEGDEFMQALPIAGQLPDEANVLAGDYPLVYPLYLYSDAGILQGKPQVAAFLNFYLNHVNEEIRALGYFPADGTALDAARTQYQAILAEK